MFELAQQAGRVFGPGGPWMGHHVGWMGPLSMLLFIAILVAGAIIVVRMLANRQPPGPAPRGPIQILEERFARGEIDEEEFRTRRDALRA
jgi:putative membrane protein